MTNRTKISSVEFLRNIGHWQNEALEKPVAISHHGRERLVLLSSKAYERLLSDSGRGQSGSDLDEQHGWLLDHIREGYVLLDASLHVLRANRSARELFASGAANLAHGARIHDVSGPGGAALREYLANILATGEADVLQPGSELFCGRDLKLFAAPCSPGLALTVVSLTGELHSKRRMNEDDALRVALGKLGYVSELALNQVGRIEAADSGFAAATGFAIGDLVGRRLGDIMSNGDRRSVNDTIEKMHANSMCVLLTTHILCRNGESALIHLSLAPVKNDGVKALVVWPHRVQLLAKTSLDAARQGEGR